MEERNALLAARKLLGIAATVYHEETSPTTGLYYVRIPTTDPYWQSGLYPIGIGQNWDGALADAERNREQLDSEKRLVAAVGTYVVERRRPNYAARTGLGATTGQPT